MSETIHPKRDLDVPWVAVPDPLDAQARHDALEALSGADQGASAAQAALRAKADPLGVTPDKWAQDLRSKVRSHPLTALASALVLGAVLARIIRRLPAA